LDVTDGSIHCVAIVIVKTSGLNTDSTVSRSIIVTIGLSAKVIAVLMVRAMVAVRQAEIPNIYSIILCAKRKIWVVTVVVVAT